MSTASDEPITWRPGRIESAADPENPSPPIGPENPRPPSGPENASAPSGPEIASAPSGRITVRAAVICLVLSVAIGALAYGIGTALPSTYQSYGLIRVALPSQQGVIDPVVTAANDIASQYAQLASSQPVAALAASRLGVRPRSLDGKITGSTVSAQNLVQVTVTAGSVQTASARAAAASDSLRSYVTGLNAQVGAQYVAGVKGGLNAIKQTLDQLNARLRKERGVARAADTAVTQTLTSQRVQLLGQVARDAASNEPSLQVVTASTGPTVTSPKPKLYALVAFIVALLVTGRAAFVLSRRRGA